MKRIATLFFLILGTCLVALAQDPPKPVAPPASPLFSTTTEAVGLNLQGQSVAATDLIASFNVTQKVAIRSHNLLAPSNNLQAYLGTARVNFDWLLDRYVSKTNIPAHAFRPYLEGGAGIVRNVPSSGQSTQSFGAIAGGGFDYDLSGSGNFKAGVSVDYFKAGTYGTGVKYSANLTYVFAKK